MTFGWAIVVVMVLYLLDKRNLFKKAFLTSAALVAIVAVTLGGWYLHGNLGKKPVQQSDNASLLQPGETLGPVVQNPSGMVFDTEPVTHDTPAGLVTPLVYGTCPATLPNIPKGYIVESRGTVCPYKHGKLDYDALAQQFGGISPMQ